MAAPVASDDDGWVRVAPPDALEVSPSPGRLHLAVGAPPRFVSVLAAAGRLACLDAPCFCCGGGPLALGAVEEVPGAGACLRCPWHGSLVSLETGETWYQHAEAGADGRLVPDGWRSNGARQRVHAVEARADGLYVRLGAGPPALPSDEFAFKSECGARVAEGALRRPGDASPVRPSSPAPLGRPEAGDAWPADLALPAGGPLARAASLPQPL